VVENSKQIFEEETAFLSEDLELSENTLIQNRKVVWNMVKLKPSSMI